MRRPGLGVSRDSTRSSCSRTIADRESVAVRFSNRFGPRLSDGTRHRAESDANGCSLRIGQRRNRSRIGFDLFFFTRQAPSRVASSNESEENQHPRIQRGSSADMKRRLNEENEKIFEHEAARGTRSVHTSPFSPIRQREAEESQTGLTQQSGTTNSLSKSTFESYGL